MSYYIGKFFRQELLTDDTIYDGHATVNVEELYQEFKFRFLQELLEEYDLVRKQ